MLEDEIKKEKLLILKNRLPYKTKLTFIARDLRKNETESEKILWKKFLSRHKYRWNRQRVIGHFIADFYCASKKTILEIDGKIHNYQKERDKERGNNLKRFGLKILRIKNIEIENNFKDVCKRINYFLEN